MKKTVGELRKLVHNLSTQKNKVDFLNSIYRPGYHEVIDLLVEMGEKVDSSIVQAELGFAIENEDEKAIDKYGKMAVDYYIENDFQILLPKELNKWGQKNLIEYALTLLPFKRDIYELEHTIRFYEEVDPENKELAELKSRHRELCLLDPELNFRALHLLEKEDPNKAIDYILERGDRKGWSLARAWGIAKEHVSGRRGEIARIILSKNEPDNGWEVCFTEAAIQLGEIKRARRVLSKVAKKARPTAPRCFDGLVKSLMLVNLTREVSLVLKKAELYTQEQRYPLDSYKEMARLCLIAEAPKATKEWFTKAIEYEVAECHPSHAPNTITEYVKLTGDVSVRVNLIPVYEREQRYAEAAQIAEEFNMNEKAVALREMHAMLPIAS